MDVRQTSSAPVGLLSLSVGVIVANIYYAQPLLAAMAATFGVSVGLIGIAAMLTQIGTAAGMVAFVPLGDNYDRRSLLTALLIGAFVSLCFLASAQNFAWLCVACLAVGATASAVHVIVPFAAQLASDATRGKVVGTVLSGLLLGILLARTFSGVAGSLWGWRAVYWIAAGAMVALTLLLRARLPHSVPAQKMVWLDLMKSIGGLVVKHAGLRESALLGALFFCVFSAFWTTLVFFLQTPPYHFGASAAGVFGLVGAAGALCAPQIGKLSDRKGPRFSVLLGLVTTLASFCILGFWGRSLAGLIVGVIVLDAGVQSGHVANQTRIYSLDPGARSRLNTVYMCSYFLGGAAGSSLGALCWTYGGWNGVCEFGAGVMLLALGIFARG